MSDALHDLTDLLPSLGAAVERRELGDRLTIIANALREAQGEIERLDALLDIVVLTDLAGATDIAELKDAAVEAAEALLGAQTSEQLREAKDSFDEFRKALVRANRQMIDRWKDIVAQEFRPLIAFGALLESVVNLADLGRRMQTCGRDAVASLQTFKLSELREIIRRLMHDAERLRVDRAASVGAIPGVGDFLSAVGDQRATLALVTPAVFLWLQQNGALDNFKVST